MSKGSFYRYISGAKAPDRASLRSAAAREGKYLSQGCSRAALKAVCFLKDRCPFLDAYKKRKWLIAARVVPRGKHNI